MSNQLPILTAVKTTTAIWMAREENTSHRLGCFFNVFVY